MGRVGGTYEASYDGGCFKRVAIARVAGASIGVSLGMTARTLLESTSTQYSQPPGSSARVSDPERYMKAWHSY